jgi:hypothetical protein
MEYVDVLKTVHRAERLGDWDMHLVGIRNIASAANSPEEAERDRRLNKGNKTTECMAGICVE